MSYAPIITLDLWDEYENYLTGRGYGDDEHRTFAEFMSWLKDRENKSPVIGVCN